MHKSESSSKLALRIPEPKYHSLHGSFPHFNSEELLRESKNDFWIKAKKNGKITDFNKKLEDILNVYKNTQRSKSNNSPKGDGCQEEDTSFDGGALIGVKSLTKKIDLEKIDSEHFQRYSSNTTLTNLEKTKRKANSTTHFPFLEFKKTFSTNFSTPNQSTIGNAKSTNLSLFHTPKARMEGISYVTEIYNEGKKRDPVQVVKSSVRKSPRSEQPKAKSVPKKLNKPKTKKATNFLENPLSYFKPIKSNYAITIRNSSDLELSPRGSGRNSPQESTRNLNGINPSQVLISSLIPPNLYSPQSKKDQSITRLFKNLDDQYSLSELGLKETNRDSDYTKGGYPITSLGKGLNSQTIKESSFHSKSYRPEFSKTLSGHYTRKDCDLSPMLNDADLSYRQIIVLYSDFIKQGNLLFGKVLIPRQDDFSSLEEAKMDFQTFLKSVEDKLLCPTTLRYACLVNGETIEHFNEIPPDSNVLLVSHSIFYQFKSRYLEYHSMKAIPNDKWNLLLFLLNKQTDPNKVRYLLTNELFNKKIVCNNLLNFDSLLEKNDVLNTQKKPLIQEKKYQSQIDEAINVIQNLYNEIKPGKPVDYDDIMQEYNKALKRIHDELQNSNDSGTQKRAMILEKLFNEFDLFLKNKEKSGLYIDCLDDILNQAYPKKNDDTVDKLLIENTQKKEPKNYIKKNIKIAGSETMRVYNAVTSQHQPLYKQNIPKLQVDSAFTRRELYKLYTKYKAVCAAFGLKKESQNKPFDPRVGFDKDTFTKNFTQFSTATGSMIDRIFTFSSEEEGQGMTWPKFLRLMMSVRAKSVKDKIALFLFLMDTDGNGSLSFPEVKTVCRSALDCIKTADDDNLMDSLSDYFAKIVFEAVETNKDAEISLEKLREIVERGLESADMLLSFAGAKQSQDEEIILESNCLENKMPKIRLRHQHLKSFF